MIFQVDSALPVFLCNCCSWTVLYLDFSSPRTHTWLLTSILDIQMFPQCNISQRSSDDPEQRELRAGSKLPSAPPPHSLPAKSQSVTAGLLRRSFVFALRYSACRPRVLFACACVCVAWPWRRGWAPLICLPVRRWQLLIRFLFAQHLQQRSPECALPCRRRVINVPDRLAPAI